MHRNIEALYLILQQLLSLVVCVVYLVGDSHEIGYFTFLIHATRWSVQGVVGWRAWSATGVFTLLYAWIIIPSPNTSWCICHRIVPVYYLIPPVQNSRHSADDMFKCIFMNETVCISNQISLKFVPGGPNNNKSALFQVMAWCRTGNKPSPEPVLVRFTDSCMRH